MSWNDDMSKVPEWSTNWHAFVRMVIDKWNAGHTDADVTACVANTPLCWEGVVKEIYEHEDRLGVPCDMPDVRFELQDGRKGVANHICLDVPRHFMWEWQDVQVGDTVKFQTFITRIWGKIADGPRARRGREGGCKDRLEEGEPASHPIDLA